MFFWKSKEEEKQERFSFSLLVLLVLFLPALLIVTVGRLLGIGQEKVQGQTGQKDTQNRATEKPRRVSEKSFAAKGAKSPEEVKDRASQKRAKTKQDDRQQAEPDDLTRIEGIGPKTVELLRGHNITTYRQLAETSVERLKSILGEAGFRINPPDTWPEQARLAAEDKMEDLDALQDRLHAGRKEKR
jgi:predicted flap endonuclease-1-like 5' DNA nuclease